MDYPFFYIGFFIPYKWDTKPLNQWYNVRVIKINPHTRQHHSSSRHVYNWLIWRTSQVTYVTMVPRVGNETLRPLGVAMGNAVSVTCVWNIHTKTQPAGRRQPMTSLLARPQYKGQRENTSSTSLSEACVRSMAHSLGDAVSLSPLRVTMVTYVTWDVPLHGNFELRSPRGCYGELYTHATMLRGA